MRFWPAIMFLVLVVGLASGCTERPPVSSPPAAPAHLSPEGPSFQKVLVASSTKMSALEESHKAYLKAYENYVKMLRESGPQTMETLNALADYQKRYQIYQMLLGAEKEPALAGSPASR